MDVKEGSNWKLRVGGEGTVLATGNDAMGGGGGCGSGSFSNW